MNTEGLKQGFVDWLAENPDWKDRLALETAEDDRLICSLDKLRITFDFRHRSFDNSSSKESMKEWTNQCEDSLASLDLSGSLRPFFSQVFTEYEEALWEESSSQESEDDSDIPSQRVEEPDNQWVLQHVVFRAAQEAQEQLEKDKGLDIMIRPDSGSVKIRLDLNALGMTAGSCEELGLMSDERVLLSLTYSNALLQSTMQEDWTSRLFDEVGICCTTEMETLNMGASLYFPGLVKLVFARLNKKVGELPPGIVLNDAANYMVQMGFSLEDANQALQKAHGDRERALEKLMRWSTLHEWICEVPNPFTCLCLSLTAFLSAHSKYCRNCYLRHNMQSQMLRYCCKRRCLQALMQTEFEVVRAAKEKESWVMLELSFLSVASQEGYPYLQKFLTSESFSGILSRLPALSNLQEMTLEGTLILEIGVPAYEILRKVLQTSPLRVTKVELTTAKLADSRIESELLAKGVGELLTVDSNSAEFVRAFEAEKAISGSKWGFYVPDGGWFALLREGTCRRTFVGGSEINCGRWAAPSLDTAQTVCAPENPTMGWPFSVHKSKGIVGIVEFISKPEYVPRSDLAAPLYPTNRVFIIPNSRHFLVRYFAIVPLPEFARPVERTKIQFGSLFPNPEFRNTAMVGTELRSPGNLSLFRQSESAELSSQSSWKGPGPETQSFPADFSSSRPGFSSPPNIQQGWTTASQAQLVDPATLSPSQQAFFYKIDEQHRRNFPRLLWELMEIRTQSESRVTVELGAGYNVFLWQVTVLPGPDWELSTELSEDFETLSQIRGEQAAVQLTVTFNAFFPLISPFFILKAPRIQSSALTKDGFILRPPMWKQDNTVLHHLQQSVKFVLLAPNTRLDLGT